MLHGSSLLEVSAGEAWSYDSNSPLPELCLLADKVLLLQDLTKTQFGFILTGFIIAARLVFAQLEEHENTRTQ